MQFIDTIFEYVTKDYKLKISINLKLQHYIIMKNVYKIMCVCFIYKYKEFENTWITKISIFLLSKNFNLNLGVDVLEKWVWDGRPTQLREMAWWPSFATCLCVMTNGFGYVTFQETSNTFVIGFWESSRLFHGKYLGWAPWLAVEERVWIWIPLYESKFMVCLMVNIWVGLLDE